MKRIILATVAILLATSGVWAQQNRPQNAKARDNGIFRSAIPNLLRN